jgi:hypothetical protein
MCVILSGTALAITSQTKEKTMSECEIYLFRHAEGWVKATIKDSIHPTPRMIYQKGIGWVATNSCVYCYQTLNENLPEDEEVYV